MIKKILSIDGGGIRGYIPAIILAHIENQTNKPISSIFDLIAGTSTGGILATGITIKADNSNKPKYKASDLIRMYEQEGKNIFDKRFLHTRLTGEIYSSNGIESVLRRYFGEQVLSHTISKLMVTSFDTERRKPKIFKNWEARKDVDYCLTDICRATSAAPLFFELHKINLLGLDYMALIDGGMIANNPAMCAYVEAKKLWPFDDIMVLSLGTGKMTRRIKYEDAKNWGIIGWAKPAFDIVFDGNSMMVDHYLSNILPHNRYFRLQTELIGANDDMDDVSDNNLQNLRYLAETMIDEKLYDFIKLIIR